MSDTVPPPSIHTDAVPVQKIVGPPRRGPAHEPFKRQKMVRWLAPGQLAVTAVRAILSGTFGAYADRRETQAALHQHDGDGSAPGSAGGRIYSYVDVKDANGDFWLDFVADLGDGFDPTYSVAWLLARGELPAPGDDVVAGVGADGRALAEDAKAPAAGDPTHRGHVLVMGGDQVYPTASREEYHNRLSGPYEAALPSVAPGERAPHLFAIPGNHDWYDGLTSFIRQFCQARGIGAWETKQSRSYWALRLPQRWWVLGVDVQLQSDIDRPQMEYFSAVAREMRPGDRVILCTPEPAWVHTRCEPNSFDNLAYFERQVITPSGAELALTLTGDLHHYARYFSGEGERTRHKITAGGGGAYLLGTQLLPPTLDLQAPPAAPVVSASDDEWTGPCERWTRGDALYPSLGASLRMKPGAFTLWFKNPSFGVLLGAVYALFGWLLEIGSHPFGSKSTLLPLLRLSGPGEWRTVAATVGEIAYFTPGLTILILLLIGGMIGFASPDVERSKLLLRHRGLRTVTRVLVGFIHGLAHVALAVALVWIWAKLRVSLPPVWIGVAFLGAMSLVGGIAGSLLFALFLLPPVNYNEAFSSQHLETYKNFVRLRIGADGRLTVWSYGVDSPGRWRFRPNAPAGNAFYDATKPPMVRLIERPITLAAPGSSAS